MSREIKFRAWVKSDERMAYSDEIVVWNNSVYINESKKLDSKIKGFSNLNRYLMQYTGLNDKNGVEIYEGDICRVTHNNSTYEYSATTTIYEVASTCYGYRFLRNNKQHSLELYRAISVEVIGNIYENPELLEVKK